MKRYGYLFEKIVDIDNIMLAHKNARKHKTHYDEVRRIDTDVHKYCEEIQRLLVSGEYRTSEYKIKQKIDKGKARTIYVLPYFPDRIVHHAIMQVLEPIWKSTLIVNTYQSIKGRGPHKMLRKVVADIRSGHTHVLKVDLTRYYPSIDNSKLKEVLRRKIKCGKTLQLLDGIVDSCKGVPIGNYLSQYFGNLYLAVVDHKISTACRYYRYCDDIVCVGAVEELWKTYAYLVEEIEGLASKVGRYSMTRVTHASGVDLLGYVVYKNRVLLRKRIKVAALTCGDSAVCSYVGWLRHCNGNNLIKKIRMRHVSTEQ